LVSFLNSLLASINRILFSALFLANTSIQVAIEVPKNRFSGSCITESIKFYPLNRIRGIGYYCVKRFFLYDFKLAIFSILIFWKIFQKFGEPGWKSIIPIYNLYIMCKYILGSGLWMLGFIVPILNIIVAIMFAIKMAQVFGKGTLFAIGLIFFPTIFQAIIAFGESTYNPSK